MQITPVAGSACASTGIAKAITSQGKPPTSLKPVVLVPCLKRAERNLGIMVRGSHRVLALRNGTRHAAAHTIYADICLYHEGLPIVVNPCPEPVSKGQEPLVGGGQRANLQKTVRPPPTHGSPRGPSVSVRHPAPGERGQPISWAGDGSAIAPTTAYSPLVKIRPGLLPAQVALTTGCGCLNGRRRLETSGLACPGASNLRSQDY